jgi:hypothetical protein
LGGSQAFRAWFREHWPYRRDRRLFQNCAILNRHAMGTPHEDVKELWRLPPLRVFLLLWWRSDCATSFLGFARHKRERLNPNCTRNCARETLAPAGGAVSTDFEAGYENVKVAIPV